MSVGTAIESAVRRHVGQLQPALVRDSDIEIETYEEVREVFGSNTEIAEAAGYGAPGQYPKGSPEWTRRRTFMRNLQRYEMGRTGGSGQRRTPSRMLPRLVTVAKVNESRRNTPTGVTDVIRLMGGQGTTSFRFKATVEISADRRDRDIELTVYTHREVYRQREWPMRGRVPRDDAEWSDLGHAYCDAFLTAYGLGGASVIDTPEGIEPIFLFTIGREDEVQYDFA